MIRGKTKRYSINYDLIKEKTKMKTNIILQGDCIEQMKLLPENSVDAIVTDPPYGIGFMGKEWDTFKPDFVKSSVEKSNRNDLEKDGMASKSGIRYDESHQGHLRFQEWIYEWSKESIRVLKPGGFFLCFGSPRCSHRIVCGIEDAGFEIRDTIMWLYGSGFPKSLNIGKQIDKMAEEDIEVIKAKQELGRWLKEKRGDKPQKEISKHFLSKTGRLTGCVANWELGLNLPTWEIWIKLKEILELDERFDYLIKGRPKDYIPAEREVVGKDGRTAKDSMFGIGVQPEWDLTKPATPEAKQWEGWGTAFKPAVEPIVVARKPLSEKNVALNVLKWGTGGINIDECRIGSEILKEHKAGNIPNDRGKWGLKEGYVMNERQGRFPANIILDEEAGQTLDEQSGISKSSDAKRTRNTLGSFGMPNDITPEYSDKGGASRFFYCAKASKSERNLGCEELNEKPIDIQQPHNSKDLEERYKMTSKNNHPTVKPIKLMEYLIKLVSKEGAIVLDPFIGSGTTAIACVKQNRKFIGIEKEEEYVKITKSRLKPFLEQRRLK